MSSEKQVNLVTTNTLLHYIMHHTYSFLTEFEWTQ